MSWQLVGGNPYANTRCNRSDVASGYLVSGPRIVNRLRSRFFRASRPLSPSCPSGGKSTTEMESELIETVVAALEQLGYRYDVSGGRAPFLWCLGGVEVLVHPDDGEDDDEREISQPATRECETPALHDGTDSTTWSRLVVSTGKLRDCR